MEMTYLAQEIPYLCAYLGAVVVAVVVFAGLFAVLLQK